MSETNNPNAVPMGAIIDVYLKHRIGPSQPFSYHEARRYAIEEVRQGVASQVVA